jgi:hypothetical protein
MTRRFTEAERSEIWDRIQAGATPASVAAAFGRFPSAIRKVQEVSGGVRPAPRRRREVALSIAEGEEISRGLAVEQSCRAMRRQAGTSSVDRAACGRHIQQSGPPWVRKVPEVSRRPRTRSPAAPTPSARQRSQKRDLTVRPKS